MKDYCSNPLSSLRRRLGRLVSFLTLGNKWQGLICGKHEWMLSVFMSILVMLQVFCHWAEWCHESLRSCMQHLWPYCQHFKGSAGAAWPRAFSGHHKPLWQHSVGIQPVLLPHTGTARCASTITLFSQKVPLFQVPNVSYFTSIWRNQKLENCSSKLKLILLLLCQTVGVIFLTSTSPLVTWHPLDMSQRCRAGISS